MILHFFTQLLLKSFSHFLLTLSLGGIFFYFDKKQIASFFLIYSGIWIFIVGISPLPIFLTQKEESRYPVLLDPLTKIEDTTAVNVLVLGAGHYNAPNFTANDRLSTIALKRLSEGIRLHLMLPNSKLMCSGYSSSGGQTQAEVLAETAILLGVNPLDTLLQGLPSNTEKEAIAYAKRFGNSKSLILVTSAIHMPRSMYWFEQQGLQPIPAPTNHLIQPEPNNRSFAFKPSLHKMIMMDRVLHEYGGMFYAWWKEK